MIPGWKTGSGKERYDFLMDWVNRMLRVSNMATFARRTLDIAVIVGSKYETTAFKNTISNYNNNGINQHNVVINIVIFKTV